MTVSDLIQLLQTMPQPISERVNRLKAAHADLYTLPGAQPALGAPKLCVGTLPSINQDAYPKMEGG